MPNGFKDGAPTSPQDYSDLGLSITPCKDKTPVVKDWQLRGLQIEVWNHKYKGVIIYSKVNYHIKNIPCLKSWSIT